MALLVGLGSLVHAQEGDPPLQPYGDGTLVSNLGQSNATNADVLMGGQMAQSFNVGSRADGSGYRLQSIRVTSGAAEINNIILVPEVRVSLHSDGGASPGPRLRALTVPDDFASTEELKEYTLTVPPETVIPGGARYWIVFENLTQTLLLGATSSAAADQDPPPAAGWSIHTRRVIRTSTTDWNRVDRSIKMAVTGLAENAIPKLGGNEGFAGEDRAGVGLSEVGGFPPGSYWGQATSFTPGGDGWYALNSITFGATTTAGGVFRVAIHGDDGDDDGPAADALYVAHVEEPAGDNRVLEDLTATFPDNATLEPGRKYWAVFDEVTGAGFYSIHLAENSNEDAGFAGWAIGDTKYQMDYLTADEFSWSASSALKPIQMAFHGYAEPERVLVGAHGLGDSAEDGPYLRFGTERVTKTWLRLPKDRTFDFCEPAFVAGSDTETSWRRCDLSPSSHYNHKWAGGRGFTTGPNPTGYTITGLGVDIDLQSGTLDPTANIYAANAFHTAAGALDPQSPLAGYRATAGAGRSPDRFAPRTSASAELQADPERAYVAYFRNAPGGYFQTPNAAGGQDPGAEAGWTLGRSYGSRFVRPLGFGGDDWNFGEGDARLVPLNVYGWPNPLPPAPNPDPPAPAPALVSNLGKASNASGFAVARTTVLDREIASSFTTGEHNAGYALHGLQIEVPSDPADFVGGLRAAIHADDGGQPGASSLLELGLQINPRSGLLTFHAPDGIILFPKTTFWVVVDAAVTATDDNSVNVAYTREEGEDDCAARDWSLGAGTLWRAAESSSWGGEFSTSSRWPFSASRCPAQRPRSASPPAATCPATPLPPGA